VTPQTKTPNLERARAEARNNNNTNMSQAWRRCGLHTYVYIECAWCPGVGADYNGCGEGRYPTVKNTCSKPIKRRLQLANMPRGQDALTHRRAHPNLLSSLSLCMACVCVRASERKGSSFHHYQPLKPPGDCLQDPRHNGRSLAWSLACSLENAAN
jgi:hypothetical protein